MKNKRVIRIVSVLVICLVGMLGNSVRVEAAEGSYSVNGQTITLSVKKNTDITDVLNKALKEADERATAKRIVKVVIPKGTYKINEKGLHIYSNTTLDLSKGVTLKYSGADSHVMLMTGTNGSYKNQSDYNNSSLCAGYNGFKNIKLVGGTWSNTKSNGSCTMRLFHAKNVTLEGVTFTGGGGIHQIEVAAIDGFYVKKCTFRDFSGVGSGTGNKLEALQLDIPVSQEVFPATYEDGTVMKNVEITGCTFSNVPRGVGSHTLLVGAYYDNIKINNNTFKNIKEEAVIALNYKNCEIGNNLIQSCGGGILFQYFKARPESVVTTIFDGKKNYSGKIQHDAKSTIHDNVITVKYTKDCDEIQGIKVYGLNVTGSNKGGDGKKIPKDNYYVSGVTVENNIISTAGFGIHMMNTRNCKIRNNSIIIKGVSSKDERKDKYDGILVENYSESASVTGNTVSGATRHGIVVQSYARVSSIENNTISNCGNSGIHFTLESGCTGDVSKNRVTDCGVYGIFACNLSQLGSILDNEVSLGNVKVGIALEHSYAKKIRGNTVTCTLGTMDCGIRLTDESEVEEISDNKILNAENGQSIKRGIFIYNKSSVSGAVAENKIEAVEAAGIAVSAEAAVQGDIHNNVVERSAGSGILISSKATVGGSIRENTILQANARGIAVIENSSVAGKITGNVIASAKRPIVVDNTSKANVVS